LHNIAKFLDDPDEDLQEEEEGEQEQDDDDDDDVGGCQVERAARHVRQQGQEKRDEIAILLSDAGDH
jgi:hypothetical protein